ncbi:MAG: UvrB/UvrC motif-containing protein, partial [Candidatus Omnitrophica bacterium]|nr:UvrB/UvrC motif-containing protein [Candidatus Omnitrophota bacterium]
KETEAADAVKCASCGLSYADFKKVGRLGCADCYNTFKKYLAPLLKRIHGSSQHFGKSPLKVTKQLKKKIDMQELRAKLQKAIELEAFEEAARIRDQMKELEKKQKEQHETE